MWHEARRQERKLRKVIVDYKKRSERRHQYYERIKQDPTKFLQVHGRKCKIHLDGTVALEADNNNHMIPWQGDNSNMIDRFDVRTHLDHNRELPKSNEEESVSKEERKCNFERYRVLISNEYKKISEHQHLKQIFVDEQFPELAAQQRQKQDADSQKQMLAQTKATIGYDYQENAPPDRQWHVGKSGGSSSWPRGGDDGSDEEDDFDIMQELEEIPPLSEIGIEAITAMNEIGSKKYGLSRGGFGDSLVDDQYDMDKVSAAKDLESEKRRYSGRKSRRERKLLKDEKTRILPVGSLSYVRQQSSESSDSSDTDSSSSSDSSSSNDSENGRSKMRESRNKIEYITSFGGGASAKGKLSESKSGVRQDFVKKRRKKSRSRSPAPRYYHRSRSRSPPRHTKYSGYSRRSRSRSFERSHRHSKSRDHRRSRSSSLSRSHSRERRSKSLERRSKSRESRYKSNNATAKINSTSQSTDSLIKSLSKHRTAEEKAAAIKKLTPQQKLKIKMQRALNKQLKVDRNADMEKRIVKQQEILEREDDLRELSRKRRKPDIDVEWT